MWLHVGVISYRKNLVDKIFLQGLLNVTFLTFYVNLQVVARAGGRQQEVIKAEGDGRREGKQDKTNVNMITKSTCGREEDTEDGG